MPVKTVEHITGVVPVNALNGFNTFRPYLEKAERWITPILSKGLYDELSNETVEPEGPSEALKLARICVVNYAMWVGFDMLNVTHDDSGFMRASKDQSLYRYQEENLRTAFKDAAFNGVDDLLEHLQVNLETYPLFADSVFYQANKGSIFPATSDFNKVYNIGGSRLVFLQLAGFFDRVVDFELKPVMTASIYDALMAELPKEDQDPDLMALLPLVRKVMAFYSVAYGLDEVGMRITEKGLFFENEVASSNSHIQTQRADVEVLRKKALLNAERYKSMLLEYMQQHPDKYDISETAKSNPFRRDNAGKKTVWF